MGKGEFDSKLADKAVDIAYGDGQSEGRKEVIKLVRQSLFWCLHKEIAKDVMTAVFKAYPMECLAVDEEKNVDGKRWYPEGGEE